MAGQRKPYNPNTAYGRRKLREEYYQKKAEMAPEERSESNCQESIIYIVVLGIIALIIFLASGKEGLLRWFTR